jgi:predicted small lipoprotein YifL
MSIFRLITLVLLIVFVSACGYKSELYLPKEKQAAISEKQTDEQESKSNDASGKQEQN